MYLEKSFREAVLIFAFKVFQIFLQRYFNSFNDNFQSSYFAGQWVRLQPEILSKKNPFICILQGFCKTFRNTYFEEDYFVPTSKRGLSGIFWNLWRSLLLENQLHYLIKRKLPTSYFILKVWRYLQDSYQKDLKKNKKIQFRCNNFLQK